MSEKTDSELALQWVDLIFFLIAVFFLHCPVTVRIPVPLSLWQALCCCCRVLDDAIKNYNDKTDTVEEDSSQDGRETAKERQLRKARLAERALVGKFGGGLVRWLSPLLNLSTAPPLCVLLFLMVGVMTPRQVFNGIFATIKVEGAGDAGGAGVKPWAIVIIFFGLAYLTMSWDTTGVFAFLGRKVVAATASSGRLAFVGFFAFASILTVATSNDVVILTMTPLIAAISHTYAKSQVVGEDLDGSQHRAAALKVAGSLGFLVFTTANIWSSFLLIGNGTNIILAGASGIDFLEHAQFMIVPALLASVAGLIAAFVHFSFVLQEVPATLLPKEKEGSLEAGSSVATISSYSRSSSSSSSKSSSSEKSEQEEEDVFSSSSSEGEEEEQQASSSSSSSFSSLTRKSTAGAKKGKKGDDRKGAADSSTDNGEDGNDEDAAVHDLTGAIVTTLWFLTFVATMVSTAWTGWELWYIVLVFAGGQFVWDLIRDMIGYYAPSEMRLREDRRIKAALEAVGSEPWFITTVLPRVMVTIGRLPWPVLPFSLSMFVLVESLSVNGWIDIFATGLRDVGAGKGIAANVFFFCFLGTLVANLVNNQPMAILFARILTNPKMSTAVQGLTLTASDLSLAEWRAAVFGCIMGSNYGAVLTVTGALAGLLWTQILRNADITVTRLQFIKHGAPLVPFICTMAAVGHLIITA